MQRVTRFDVVAAQREPMPRVELVRGDSGETLTLDAAALVAQYLLDSGELLLVLDEDNVYEEQVHLVLVRGTAVVDHLVIGAPYATGLFREVACDSDDLRFRFAGETVLTLSVRATASRGGPRLPAGARRRGGWFAAHRLILTTGAP